MIEAPVRGPNPHLDPIGKKPQKRRRQSAPLGPSMSSTDDVFRAEPREKTLDIQVRGAEHDKMAAKEYDGERLETGLADVKNTSESSENWPPAEAMGAEQGRRTAAVESGQLYAGNVSLTKGHVFPSSSPSVDGPIGISSERKEGIQSESHNRRLNQREPFVAANQKEKVLKLTPARIHELTSTPESLPVRIVAPHGSLSKTVTPSPPTFNLSSELQSSSDGPAVSVEGRDVDVAGTTHLAPVQISTHNGSHLSDGPAPLEGKPSLGLQPNQPGRASSSPSLSQGLQSSSSVLRPRAGQRRTSKHTPTPLRFDDNDDGKPSNLHSSVMEDMLPSPVPKSIPLPLMSLPTYLQLELSSHRPSPLYIHRSVTSDFPYESSRVKIERLLNFLFLPPQLEQVIWFGTFACLDAWLYTFTILPLRLSKSFYILGQSWVSNLAVEVQYLASFVYAGTGRMWKRRRTRGPSISGGFDIDRSSSVRPPKPDLSMANGSIRIPEEKRRPSVVKRHFTEESVRKVRRHRRTKSVPSALLPDDKADMLKGLLIISTCLILLRLDASRMYHWIRGQAAIKLYVFYNVLEVGDRLLSAIGQDVLECLFSREALERGPDGHSKVIRPFWLFLMALTYTVTHATALFYQVITLNVAVNSYSNALITLLMSNQFVEIKSTVFKKFEKENLFQLTCADVVERFQLWLMLLIIASRNMVETGGLAAGSGAFGSSPPSFPPTSSNASNPLHQSPRSSASILPRSFTLLPNMLLSLTAYAPSVGHVLGPFFVVLGSEMLVDWLKHSYVTKFNNTRPAIYGRFLDVLAKDYYSHAFADQNLTKRLGLPVIPLSCLFIRASFQTYQMFQAAWIPPTLSSSATGLTSDHHHYYTDSAKPGSTASALSQDLYRLLRYLPASAASSSAFSHLGTVMIFLLVFLVLLTIKLVMGMLLLAFARSRYRSMKEREKSPIHHVEGGRRVGGWGVIEVDEDKRRWIYEGDAEGARQLKEREERDRVRREKGTGEGDFEKVKRYEMVAKRIW